MRKFVNYLLFILPKKLLFRTSLMVILPVLLVQLIVIFLFLFNHWDRVSKQLAVDLRGDILSVISGINDTNNDISELSKLKSRAYLYFDLQVDVLNEQEINITNSKLDLKSKSFADTLKSLSYDWQLNKLNSDYYQLYVKLDTDKFATIKFHKRRIYSSSIWVVIFWGVAISVLLLIVAEMFLRIQIRSISRLSSLAERLGMGGDIGEYKPHGSIEVRKLARSILMMWHRLTRHVDQRTLMLSGISHDIKTVITRMKLELEVLDSNDDEAVDNLKDDLLQMENMIKEWLDSIRGNEAEVKTPCNMNILMSDIVEKFQRNNNDIEIYFNTNGEIRETLVRKNAIIRAIYNILDNSIKYHANVIKVSTNYVENGIIDGNRLDYLMIEISDNGIGVDEDKLAEITKPFYRVETSRNRDTGGTGLGLSIVSDIIYMHGGELLFTNNYPTGLKVTIILPYGE